MIAAGRVPPEAIIGRMILGAAALGVVVFAAALFGNYTRPVGHLSAFWPANALLLGLMLRCPSMATPLGVFAAATAYVSADLSTGGTLPVTLLLSSANLIGAVVGYSVFSRFHEDDRHLRRPISVFYLALGACSAAAAAGAIGAFSYPILFNGSAMDGWAFWFISELVTYVTLLPVILTFPSLSGPSMLRLRWPAALTFERIAPVVALILSAAVALVVGGPGAVAFPVPALLWCALTFDRFAVAVLTLAFSVWTLLAISTGLLHLSFDNNDWSTLMSIRTGVTLMALAPLTVATVTTARNELLQRLSHLATHDQLTGVLNRSAFRERAGALLTELAAKNLPAAVLMIDIDRFKAINDTFGHAAGDQVLADFARIARRYVNDSTDMFGRLGGEEFAILLTGRPPVEARAVAERIRAGFAAEAILVEDRYITATVSIGCAVAAWAPSGLDGGLLAADKALYCAKKAGRNQVETVAIGAARGRTARAA